MDKITQFSAYQIVSLEQGNSRLYSDVIQVITERELCWVRPLFLVVYEDSEVNSFTAIKEVCDLRLTSDLIFPIRLFKPALDTEVIPIFAQLDKITFTLDDIQKASSQLHRFINRIWQ